MKFQPASPAAYKPTPPVSALPADLALFPAAVRKLAEQWQQFADREQDAGDQCELLALRARAVERQDEIEYVEALRAGNDHPPADSPAVRKLQSDYDEQVRKRRSLRQLRDEAGRALLTAVAQHHTPIVDGAQRKLERLFDKYERAMADAERECDRHAQAVDDASDILQFIDGVDRRDRPVGAHPTYVARARFAEAKASSTRMRVVVSGLVEPADPLTLPMTGDSGAVFEAPTLTARSFEHDRNTSARIVGEGTD